MKKFFLSAILIILLLASLLAPGALAVVSQSEEYYVADYAGVLTETTKNDIISANVDLEAKCKGAQIVIVTIDELDGGLDSEEYATQLFNDWGVGTLEANNGMLLLLVTEEYKGWLSVGAGISGSFTSRMADDYLNTYFWDEVDARNYDTAIRNICEALFSWYADHYGVNQGSQGGGSNAYIPDVPDNGNYYYQEPYRETRYVSVFSGFFTTFWFIVLFFIVIVIFASAGADRRRHRAYYVHMGMPIPPYHWWYMWGHRPHRVWYNGHWRGGPRGPRGPGGPGSPPRGPGGGGGRNGRSGGSGGGFGGFGGGGGGHSGGGFGGFGGGGGHSGGGFGGGGGGFSGGGGGRR